MVQNNFVARPGCGPQDSIIAFVNPMQSIGETFCLQIVIGEVVGEGILETLSVK